MGNDDMERRESHIDIADKISRIEVTIARGFAEGASYYKSTAKDIELLRTSQDKIMHSLYGNGSEGLVTRVAKIAQKMNILWGVVWALAVGMFASQSGVSISTFLKGL